MLEGTSSIVGRGQKPGQVVDWDYQEKRTLVGRVVLYIAEWFELRVKVRRSKQEERR